MRDGVTEQLSAIHAMLASGQRSLRLERHTLLLWGLAGAGLLILGDWILTPEQLPDVAKRATAWLGLLSATLGGVGWWDWRLTHRVKRSRDETWSFIHRQVLKVWWSLIALAILTTFAMFFLGGGLMVYALWMVVVGVGLYVHGLFSDRLVEWIGGLTVAMGVASVALHLDHHQARWLAASLFGVGLPLLALISDLQRWDSFMRRAVLIPLWLAAVMVPAALLPRVLDARKLADYAPSLSWAAYRDGAVDLRGARDLVIPAGTLVPLHLTLDGEVFRFDGGAEVMVRTQLPLTLRLVDGTPSGDVRIGDGPWRPAMGGGRLMIPHIGAELTQKDGLRFTLDSEVHPVNAGR